MRYLLVTSVAILTLTLHFAGLVEAVGSCIPSATTLCIDDQPGDGRFRVQVTYETAQGGGQAGNGHAIPLSSLGVTHGGLIWFFEPDNPELLLKILPKCTPNEGNVYWVFASAGTNVGVTITITDTVTNAQKAYTNPDLNPMTPVQDIGAFPCTSPPSDPLLPKTELLKGHWHFAYTIISTFTNDYDLKTIDGSKNSEGGYFIFGTDEYGGPVVASYFPIESNWALLDPSIIIDRFYVFYTNGTTVLPGSCYYQINPPGSSNFSQCYPLTGVKSPLTAGIMSPRDSRFEVEEDRARLEEQEGNLPSDIDPMRAIAIQQYLQLKGLVPY